MYFPCSCFNVLRLASDLLRRARWCRKPLIWCSSLLSRVSRACETWMSSAVFCDRPLFETSLRHNTQFTLISITASCLENAREREREKQSQSKTLQQTEKAAPGGDHIMFVTVELPALTHVDFICKRICWLRVWRFSGHGVMSCMKTPLV